MMAMFHRVEHHYLGEPQDEVKSRMSAHVVAGVSTPLGMPSISSLSPTRWVLIFFRLVGGYP